MKEVVNIEVSDTAVALPVDKKVLGDFISGLLGQPQTLERRFEAAFSVDHQWLIHFFSLIRQRIQQQNAPEPLAFETTIYYRDNVERKISTWPAFEHFAETQNIISTGAKFHLALLIHFPSKQAPERQELIVDFDSRDTQQTFIESLVGRSPTTGVIAVEIRHTERTWADDILRIIQTELTGIQATEGSLKKHLRKALFPLFAFTFPIVMIASTFYAEWSKKTARESLDPKIRAMLENGSLTLETLHAKVNLLLSDARIGSQSKFSDDAVLIYALIFMLVVFFAGILLARPNPSFVILSEAAARHKIKTLERLKRKNVLLLASMVVSLFLGVAGNFIYDKIK